MTRAITGTVAAVAAITRSQDQIVQRLNEVRERDVFGFEWPEYLGALDFQHAKPFLKTGTTEAAWNKVRLYKDTNAIIATMKGYMSRAWKNANAKQGANTVRSLMHYQAWLWLLGEDEFLTQVAQAIPSPYGKDALNLICQKFGFKSADDGDRSDPPTDKNVLDTDTKEQVAEAKVEKTPVTDVPQDTMSAVQTMDIGDAGVPVTESDQLASLLASIGGSNPNLAALLGGGGLAGFGGEEGDPVPGSDDSIEEDGVGPNDTF